MNIYHDWSKISIWYVFVCYSLERLNNSSFFFIEVKDYIILKTCMHEFFIDLIIGYIVYINMIIVKYVCYDVNVFVAQCKIYWTNINDQLIIEHLIIVTI